MNASADQEFQGAARPEPSPSPETLRREAEALGLRLPADASRQRIAVDIQRRRDLIAGLSRDGLTDVLAWAGEPFDPEADNETLAKAVVRISLVRFPGLGREGLVVVAALRGIKVPADADEETLRKRIQSAETFSQYLHRKKRRLAGKLIARLLGESVAAPNGSQRSEHAGTDLEAAEAKAHRRAQSIKERIEARGVVGGLAERIRHEADDYIAAKLDEVELRIDRKLDEIDQRLAEWRDREIANRLRIIRITLWVSILVALISLAYAWIAKHVL